MNGELYVSAEDCGEALLKAKCHLTGVAINNQNIQHIKALPVYKYSCTACDGELEIVEKVMKRYNVTMCNGSIIPTFEEDQESEIVLCKDCGEQAPFIADWDKEKLIDKE